jgi:hypothetical protein
MKNWGFKVLLSNLTCTATPWSAWHSASDDFVVQSEGSLQDREARVAAGRYTLTPPDP